jgi:hypothetical protein
MRPGGRRVVINVDGPADFEQLASGGLFARKGAVVARGISREEPGCLAADEKVANRQPSSVCHRRATLDCGTCIEQDMNDQDLLTKDDELLRKKVSRLNRFVQSLCGLYSRIARQLQVDRSYVSRVARGERRSPQIEQALSSEFTRIMQENESQTTR